AEARLGIDGFNYRVAKIEEADDIPSGSVDMVFAMNVLHFCDQNTAMQAIATQLRSGGTFACAGFGPALFKDAKVQDVWNRISKEGGRVLLKRADQPQETIKVMERSTDGYNVAPLDEKLFVTGARRIHINMENGGIAGILPPEMGNEEPEPIHTGEHDVETVENEEGWHFRTDLECIKEHYGTFPYSVIDPDVFADLWREMEGLLSNGNLVEGCFPAKIILATRR
ncbi:hypothetical protein GQ43DRAFT_361627, partial [Delitschia confertaspora ATCC 74209]